MPLFATILAVSLVSLYTAGFATILICDDNDKQSSKPEEETEELLGEREDEKDKFLEKRKEDAEPEVLRNPLPPRALPTIAGSSAQAR
ncbi:hypothetical protein CFIO01_12226 [Colletotrichum fioriniae PJ7]|uniref:Uncharacterized protein n=1 Tax=Colletotrichum fioriniae PJ7 TaxID=1445577 RepID=A0A010RGM5_9PEZI|nr:hypothetical protein CFIO01_12226 [Colletotrichum fioriniae PJ7]